jgi:uncharacterized membrane protein YdjX (TVP38/TMEM64 family)
VSAIARRAAIGALLIAGLGAGIYYGRSLNVDALLRVAGAAKEAAPIAFVAVYALATVLFIPGSMLTLAGGALFGPVAGTFYSLTGATLGATLAFLAARYLARGWATRRLRGGLAEFVRGVDDEGWRFVAFVRLVPLLPFNLLNYALGLTGIRLWQYVATSYVAMLPGAAAYTYLGYAGREAFAGADTFLRNALIGAGLLAVALYLPRLVRRPRSAPQISPEELARRLRGNEPMTIVDVRGEDEYRDELGHLPGALNIPLVNLADRLSELDAARQQPVVLVCRTDKRSAKAAALLRAAGFAHVAVLRGGMMQWSARG